MKKSRPLVFVSPKTDDLGKAIRHIVYAQKLMPADLRGLWAPHLRDLRRVLEQRMAREAGCESYAEMTERVKAIQNGEASPFALCLKTK